MVKYQAKQSEGDFFHALCASKTASSQLFATGTAANNGPPHDECPEAGQTSSHYLGSPQRDRWRDRWHAAEPRLQAIEETGKRKLLSQAIEALLTDEQRPGAPATFTFEQFMQIMALACETPEASDRPVSTWTPRELADEAVKRGIVEQISPRTVERFLKGERVATPSQAVLAHATTRRSH